MGVGPAREVVISNASAEIERCENMTLDLVSTLLLWMGEMDVLVGLEYVYRMRTGRSQDTLRARRSHLRRNEGDQKQLYFVANSTKKASTGAVDSKTVRRTKTYWLYANSKLNNNGEDKPLLFRYDTNSINQTMPRVIATVGERLLPRLAISRAASPIRAADQASSGTTNVSNHYNAFQSCCFEYNPQTCS